MEADGSINFPITFGVGLGNVNIKLDDIILSFENIFFKEEPDGVCKSVWRKRANANTIHVFFRSGVVPSKVALRVGEVADWISITTTECSWNTDCRFSLVALDCCWRSISEVTRIKSSLGVGDVGGVSWGTERANCKKCNKILDMCSGWTSVKCRDIVLKM